MEFSEIEHKIVNGTIISITEDKVIVNIGDDCDGIIPGEEFKYNSYTKEGEQIEVYVKGKDAEGNITLSYWEARSIRTWENSPALITIMTLSNGVMHTGSFVAVYELMFLEKKLLCLIVRLA